MKNIDELSRYAWGGVAMTGIPNETRVAMSGHRSPLRSYIRDITLVYTLTLNWSASVSWITFQTPIVERRTRIRKRASSSIAQARLSNDAKA